MTRINIVPPNELYDQHLIAEYREIRALTRNLDRAFHGKKGVPFDRIPSKYTLNAGHQLFFADKGAYIYLRYKQIQKEMKQRGFAINFPEIDISIWPIGYFNDWEPTEEDMEIIRARIKEKVALKPHWYRYKGVNASCL